MLEKRGGDFYRCAICPLRIFVERKFWKPTTVKIFFFA